MGYVTLICNGPRTAGTGGSFGFGAGMAAGMSGCGGGAGTGTEGRLAGAQDAATSAKQHEKTLIVEAFM